MSEKYWTFSLLFGQISQQFGQLSAISGHNVSKLIVLERNL